MRAKGFTLIELIVVVSVIAVLAGIVVPTIGSLVDEARDSKMVAEVKHLATAILQYDKKIGWLPYAGLGNGTLVYSYAQTDAQTTTLNNLILAYVGRRMENDPWNRNYKYWQRNTMANGRATALSYGRNNCTALWNSGYWSNRTEPYQLTGGNVNDPLANGYYLVFK
jgi:general secretion pathway protein G